MTTPPTPIQRHWSTNQIQRQSLLPSTKSQTHHHQPDSRPLSRSNSFDSSSAHSPNLDQISLSNNPIGSSTPSSSASNLNPSLFDPLPQLPSRLRQATLKLVPPPNFGFVEESLFRSGEPAELSLDFIQRLGLNSLLWLAPQPPSFKFREFLGRNSIQFHDLGIQHAASLDAVTEEAVTEALKLILNPTIYPLMIMCSGGSHRTGTVVGCLRKLQGWNLASIFEEYRRYAGAQHHFMNEQFIEFYNTSRLVTDLTNEEPNETDSGRDQSTSTANNRSKTPSTTANHAHSLSPAPSQPSPSFNLAVHQIDHDRHPDSGQIPSHPTLAPDPLAHLDSLQHTPPKFKRATPASSLSF